MKHCKIVIGKNFGDEGKGMLTAAFAHDASAGKASLVVKSNGGAQAGHTVEHDDIRFVFHQLGSGSLTGADTLLADSFLVDLYQLPNELHDYHMKCRQSNCSIPKIYASKDCLITTVYDVLLNNIVETLRNSEGKRHGSCGMGIYEAIRRSETIPIRLKDITSEQELLRLMRCIQTKYVKKRLSELTYKQLPTELLSLLQDDNVCLNSTHQMYTSLRQNLILYNGYDELRRIFDHYEQVIFENSQGLLLDRNNTAYFPHLTPSNTGSFHPLRLLKAAGYQGTEATIEVCYVTRSYVTRHGAGRLDYECDRSVLPNYVPDRTNVPNEWQQTLRYAKHGSTDNFFDAILRDEQAYCYPVRQSIAITHLNETDHCLLTTEGLVSVPEYLAANAATTTHSSYCLPGGSIYLSSSADFAQIIKC